MPAERPSLEVFARFAVEAPRKARPESNESKKIFDKPSPDQEKPVQDSTKSDGGPTHSSGFISWISLVVTGALGFLSVVSVVDLIRWGDPLFSFESLQGWIFGLDTELGSDPDHTLYPLIVLAVAGIIFAWITRKLRKKRVVPYRYWMPVVSAFLLGFQVLPLGFSEPIYTEEPSYHETLYSFGLAALFAMAAYFFFRPRSGE